MNHPAPINRKGGELLHLLEKKRRHPMATHPTDTKQDLEKILQEWDNPGQAVIPMFHYFMERENYVSPEALEMIGQMTGFSQSDLLGVGTFYQYFSFHKEGRHIIRVCLATPCVYCGGKDLLSALQKELGIGLDETTPDGVFSLKPAQCIGQCHETPTLVIGTNIHNNVTPGEIPALLKQYREGKVSPQPAVPMGPPLVNDPVVFTGLKAKETLWIDRYESGGGYAMLREIMAAKDRIRVMNEIESSVLSGRGGGAFPMAPKLKNVMKNPKPHYVVANADEGEPGTFKDRYIMERDPHSFLEGMILASYAIDADAGYIYLREEYPHSYQILLKALDEARARGYLGKNILGTGWDYDIRIYRGGGAYICGEDSSLLNSLEGKRGTPRNKPPRLSDIGLWKKPTDVNNVETFAAIPRILKEGGAWYKSLGDEKSAGTKLFCLSGNIRRPGIYEVPLGATLRHLIEDLGGGVPDGRKFKAVLPAGSASSMLYPVQMDMALDYPTVKAAGAFLGAASLIVMDDSVCMVDLAFWMSGFYHHESCGQCTPCRDGTEDIHEVLQKIVMGEGELSHLEFIKSLGEYMRTASICGLGTSAPNIPISSIEHFEEEWREHILDHRCRTGICSMSRKKLVDFPVRRSRGLLADLPLFHPQEG